MMVAIRVGGVVGVINHKRWSPYPAVGQHSMHAIKEPFRCDFVSCRSMQCRRFLSHPPRSTSSLVRLQSEAVQYVAQHPRLSSLIRVVLNRWPDLCGDNVTRAMRCMYVAPLSVKMTHEGSLWPSRDKGGYGRGGLANEIVASSPALTTYLRGHTVLSRNIWDILRLVPYLKRNEIWIFGLISLSSSQ